MGVKEKFVMYLPAFDAALSDKYTKIKNDNSVAVMDSVDADAFNDARDCINKYNEIYSKIPYPFSYTENSIKYCMIGSILQQKYGVAYAMDIDEGLIVQISDSVALKFVRDKVSFIERKDNPNDAVILDIEQYKNNVQYEMFYAISEKIMDGQDTYNIYKDKMPYIYKFFRNDKDLFTQNMERLLLFEPIPKMKQGGNNQIIDYVSGLRYYISIYPAGDIELESEDDEDVMIIKRDRVIKRTMHNTVKEYKYSLEEIITDDDEKLLSYVDDEDKNKDNVEKCADYIFNEVVKYTNGIYSNNRLEYSGYVVDRSAVIMIGKKILVCNLERYKEPRLITTGDCLNIVAVTNEFVYVEDKIKVDGGTIKYIYYKFNLITNKKTLCYIKYRGEDCG